MRTSSVNKPAGKFTVSQIRPVLLKLFFVVLIICGVSYAIDVLPAFSEFNQQWIDAHTRNNGLKGALLFLVVAVCLLSVGVPRQGVAFLGGYAFGFTEGFVYSTIAATVSCSICFLVSRLFARKLVQRLFPVKIVRISSFLSGQTFLKAFVIRLLPLGNNLITNIIAGVTTVNPLPFITGSALGYIPQMAIFALMGKGIVVQSGWKLAFSVCMLGVSMLLSIYLYRRYKADKMLNDSPPSCPAGAAHSNASYKAEVK